MKIVKPDFIIPGAAKAGTTSLHRYFNLHPDIVMTHEKKSHFFTLVDENSKWKSDYEGIAIPNEGIEDKLYGLKCTSYLANPVALQRIKEIMPDVRLIIVLRNPLERIISHYKWLVMLGEENRPFKKAVFENFDLETRYNTGEGGNWKTYFTTSLYGKQIRHIYNLFPRNNIFVVTTNDLAEFPLNTLNECFDFLDLKKLDEIPEIKTNVTKTKKSKLPIKAGIKALKHNFFGSLAKLPQSLKKEILKRTINKKKLIKSISEEDKSWLMENLKTDIELFREYHPEILKQWNL